MTETPSDYRIEIDAPGVEMDRVRLAAGPVRGTITVSADPAPPVEPLGEPILSERGARDQRGWSRTLPIAWDADVQSARASLHHGILRVVVPRLPSSARAASRP